MAHGGATLRVYMKDSAPGAAHSSWQPIGVLAKTSALPSMWPVYLQLSVLGLIRRLLLMHASCRRNGLAAALLTCLQGSQARGA